MKEKKYNLSQIAISLKMKQCLDCREDIDKSFDYKYKWTLPVCRKCRLKHLRLEGEENV